MFAFPHRNTFLLFANGISCFFWPTFSERRSKTLRSVRLSKWSPPGLRWNQPIRTWEPQWAIRWKCLLCFSASCRLNAFSHIVSPFNRLQLNWVFLSSVLNFVGDCSFAAPSPYWWKHWMRPPLTTCAALSPMMKSSPLSEYQWIFH